LIEADEQPPAEEEVPPLVLEGRELIAKLSRAESRIQVLNGEAEGAEGEDLEVLSRQIAETKIEYLLTIDRLVDNLDALEREGLAADEVREVLQRDLSRLGPAIVEHIDAALAAIRELRKQRAGIDDADLPALEQAIHREVDWLQ
jgi:hypothetical protein